MYTPEKQHIFQSIIDGEQAVLVQQLGALKITNAQYDLDFFFPQLLNHCAIHNQLECARIVCDTVKSIVFSVEPNEIATVLNFTTCLSNAQSMEMLAVIDQYHTKHKECQIANNLHLFMTQLFKKCQNVMVIEHYLNKHSDYVTCMIYSLLSSTFGPQTSINHLLAPYLDVSALSREQRVGLLMNASQKPTQWLVDALYTPQDAKEIITRVTQSPDKYPYFSIQLLQHMVDADALKNTLEPHVGEGGRHARRPLM